MQLNQPESLAALRILIAVAKADGEIRPEERNVLEQTLRSVRLPKEITFDRLVSEEPQVEELFEGIQSQSAREQIFNGAFAIAYLDAMPSPAARSILEDMRVAFEITPEREGLTTRLLRELKETVVPGTVTAIADPQRREAAVDGDIRKYSTLTAVLGAFPVPIADLSVNVGVVALQTKMFHDIGRYYGFTSTPEQLKNVFAGVGVSSGLRFALVSLSKLIPAWGSVLGAATNFAATWALGKVAKRYYEKEERVDTAELKAIFQSGQAEARAVFERERAAVESAAQRHRGEVQRLSAELAAGRLSLDRFQLQVAELL